MKFIRSLIYQQTDTTIRSVYWRLKWIYEFWGFCVNGTASVTDPGGFAAVFAPTSFTNGTALMASGTDGSHPVFSGDTFSGECVFTSLSSTFTVDMIGKALVMWKPNSGSSEDSIYVITNVLNSNQLVFNVNTGGTPNPTTKHPSLTSRTNVNFRVVDMIAAWASISTTNDTASYGFGFVLNLKANTVNPGQGNVNGYSQLLLSSSAMHLSISGTNPNICLNVVTSGSGAWNGATIPIQTISNTTPRVVTTSSPHGLTTGQSVHLAGVNMGAFGGSNAQSVNGSYLITVLSPTTFSLLNTIAGSAYVSGGTLYNAFPNDGYTSVNYYTPRGGSFSTGNTCVNMIADETFLIAHLRQNGSGTGNTLHVEIPKRLYEEEQDKHPLAYLVEITNDGNALNTSSTTRSYGGGWRMCGHSSDSGAVNANIGSTTNQGQNQKVQLYRTLVKALRGDGTPDVFGQNMTDYRYGYNTVNGTVLSSDGVLCCNGTNNQFQFARVRLRTVKFSGTHLPVNHRIGQNGEWIHAQNGICWPWDNTIIPYQLLFYGSG